MGAVLLYGSMSTWKGSPLRCGKGQLLELGRSVAGWQEARHPGHYRGPERLDAGEFLRTSVLAACSRSNAAELATEIDAMSFDCKAIFSGASTERSASVSQPSRNRRPETMMRTGRKKQEK